ncbi:hypothetical protein BT96DRAFT_1019130 [Gymnopus androsaceus JB14]|uniref:F-box domain-containing protein n=1 Tax=Gymnopus androsaceus JB14 TaxID=1447944 RepID=A0A6A4HTA8_9AGAR|nr:hypothetical protein BT96DRAFT_1019130 [Gymnopus androsaceus JB14]
MSSLPVELLELILHDFWAQPLSTRDRATFMKSSLAVSKAWASIYMRMFCEDVHIPSGGFALKFLEILRNESPLYHYHTQGSVLLNRRFATPEHPMGLAIFTVLRALYFTPYFLPNLRRISILYNNSPMSDLFARNKFMGFPPQVTTLEIYFAYDPSTDPQVIKAITEDEQVIGLVPGTMANVRCLHAVGLPHAMVEELLLACSHWEELETEVGDFEAAVPPNVRLLALRQRSISRKQKYVAYSILLCSFMLLASFGLIALAL